MANRLRDDQHDEIVAEINMTPLIDIMLVLLILFMVTSSVSLESGLDVDLPEASSPSKGSESSVVIISLDKLGNISVNGKKSELENLAENLKIAFSEEKTDLVILEGDKNATLDKTIQIMDIAKVAGAKKFAIAAQSSE